MASPPQKTQNLGEICLTNEKAGKRTSRNVGSYKGGVRKDVIFHFVVAHLELCGPKLPWNLSFFIHFCFFCVSGTIEQIPWEVSPPPISETKLIQLITGWRAKKNPISPLLTRHS